ncbi:MAG: hypothetical protein LBF70_02740, partial [Holosporales bacterium]|nr:hypothetical protein [Holosporales bacterium]
KVSQLRISTGIKLTKFWKLTVSKIFNLKSRTKNLAQGIFANYEDECFSVGLGIHQSKFSDKDIKPNTGFIIVIMFKTLGNYFSKSNNAILHTSKTNNIE